MGRMLRMEDQLHEPAAIAQVDEDEAAVVATAVHPARDARLVADLVLADVPTPERAVTVLARCAPHRMVSFVVTDAVIRLDPLRLRSARSHRRCCSPTAQRRPPGCESRRPRRPPRPRRPSGARPA